MRDLRDFLSCDPHHVHVEKVVFTETIGHSGKTQRHSYLGATSAGRFLLIDLVSPEAATRPLEPADCRWIYARSGGWDFIRNGDLPIVSARPRTQQEPEMERTFRGMESMLRGGLSMGIGLAKPGSFRWDGDTFVAAYVEAELAGRPGVRIMTPDGKDASEAIKEEVLANLQAQQSDGSRRFSFSHCEQNISLAGMAETDDPKAGSVEARILALWADRERQRMRQGIRGKLMRSENGRAIEIVADGQPSFRARLYYEPSAKLPLFIPHRIESFIESAEARPGGPDRELVFHSLQIVDEVPEDTIFDPWSHLNPRSFVRGVWRPDGTTIVPDVSDQRFIHQFIQERHLKRRSEG
jgi:hypothetical protein